MISPQSSPTRPLRANAEDPAASAAAGVVVSDDNGAGVSPHGGARAENAACVPSGRLGGRSKTRSREASPSNGEKRQSPQGRGDWKTQRGKHQRSKRSGSGRKRESPVRKESPPAWIAQRERLEQRLEAHFPGALRLSGKAAVLKLVAELELVEGALEQDQAKALAEDPAPAPTPESANIEGVADEEESVPEVVEEEQEADPVVEVDTAVESPDPPPPEFIPAKTVGAQEWVFDWGYLCKIALATLLVYTCWAVAPGYLHELNFRYTTESWHYTDLLRGDLALFGRPTELGLAINHWVASLESRTTGWILSLCWFLWVVYLRPIRYRRRGFPDIGAEIKRIAAVHALDENLLSHLTLKTMLASKTKFHADNVRYAGVQWIRLNRKSWSEMQILEQVTRAVGVCMEATPCETALFSYWEAEGVLDSMRVVTQWVKEGLLPAGGRMALA